MIDVAELAAYRKFQSIIVLGHRRSDPT